MATGWRSGRACSTATHAGEREVVDTAQAGDPGELLAFLAWHAARTPDAAGFWPAQAVANHALCGVGAIDSSTAMTAYPLHNYVEWDAELAPGSGRAR